MNKNIMFLLALVANGCIINIQANDKPVLLKNFDRYTTIELNGSKKTIEEIVNSQDPENNEIPLVAVKEDESIKSLGTIGKPWCKTPNNISEYIELLKDKGNTGGWCGTPTNVFFVTALDNKSLERMCAICKEFKNLQNKKQNLEEDILKTSL